MSAIALAWVASIKVGNQTAKQLLQFYACHNFGRPGFEFKNSTLANQLEVEERTIRRAHKFLLDNEWIKKEERFDKNGMQLSNHMFLNIPQEFVDNFMGEGDIKSALGRTLSPGGEDIKSALLNNKLNNKCNNKEKALNVNKLTKETFTFTREEMAEALERDIDIQKVFNKFVDYKPIFKLSDWQEWFKREKNGKKAKNKHLDEKLSTHEQFKKLECGERYNNQSMY